MSQLDGRAVIGATRAGKAAWMQEKLAEYAKEHPLGKATPWHGMLLLEPGPPVIQGEVIRPELEEGRDDGA